MNQRYKVIEGAQDVRAPCLGYTVVDTGKPTSPTSRVFKVVCETARIEEAELVCNALNTVEKPLLWRWMWDDDRGRTSNWEYTDYAPEPHKNKIIQSFCKVSTK